MLPRARRELSDDRSRRSRVVIHHHNEIPAQQHNQGQLLEAFSRRINLYCCIQVDHSSGVELDQRTAGLRRELQLCLPETRGYQKFGPAGQLQRSAAAPRAVLESGYVGFLATLSYRDSSLKETDSLESPTAA